MAFKLDRLEICSVEGKIHDMGRVLNKNDMSWRRRNWVIVVVLLSNGSLPVGLFCVISVTEWMIQSCIIYHPLALELPSESLIKFLLILILTESGNRCGPFDYHIGPGGGDWFLQALYVTGHFHHDQEAPKI